MTREWTAALLVSAGVVGGAILAILALRAVDAVGWAGGGVMLLVLGGTLGLAVMIKTHQDKWPDASPVDVPWIIPWVLWWLWALSLFYPR